MVEVTAPEHYILDGTVFTAQRNSEATFRFRDANVSLFGGTMSFTNVAEPPVEPPVDPPVEPPVEPPVQPPVTPEEPKTPEAPKTEELAYTGSETPVGLIAGALALIAAGAGSLAFRRRRA